jgi:hypothetical protein
MTFRREDSANALVVVIVAVCVPVLLLLALRVGMLLERRLAHVRWNTHREQAYKLTEPIPDRKR